MKGKVAAITGGSGTLGKAFAKGLAEQGAKAVSYTHLTLPTKA